MCKSDGTKDVHLQTTINDLLLNKNFDKKENPLIVPIIEALILQIYLFVCSLNPDIAVISKYLMKAFDYSTLIYCCNFLDSDQKMLCVKKISISIFI